MLRLKSTMTGFAQSQRATLVFILLFSIFLSIKLFYLIEHYAVTLLFWDQWDFYTPLFAHQGIWDMFTWQHGPHRQGIGFVITSWIATWTDWNTRVDAFFIGSVLCITLALALYLKWRLFSALHFSDILIAMIFLTPAQYEALVGTQNISHGVFPIFMIMLYCLAWITNLPPFHGPEQAPRSRVSIARYSVILILNFLLIYTGFGIFMGIITLGLLGLDCMHMLRDRRWQSLVISTLALALALLSLRLFLIDYKFMPAVSCFDFPHQKPWEYAWFGALMLANMVGLKQAVVPFLASVVGIGLVILVLAIFVYHAWKMIMRTSQFHSIDLIITILLGYSLLYCLNTAVGRVCLGVGAAQASRYITLLIPAFLGLYFHFLTMRSKKLRMSLIALYAVLIMHGSLFLQPEDKSQMIYFSNGKQQWKTCYLETKSIVGCNNTTGFIIYPIEIDDLQNRLEYLERHHLNLFTEE